MITEAKNKAAKKRKKNPEEGPKQPVGDTEVISPAAKPATKPPEYVAAKCSCAACHGLVEREQLYRCRNCGVNGCTECGYEPRPGICPKCGARQ